MSALALCLALAPSPTGALLSLLLGTWLATAGSACVLALAGAAALGEL